MQGKLVFKVAKMLHFATITVVVWQLETQADLNNCQHVIRLKHQHGLQYCDAQPKAITELTDYEICKVGNQTYCIYKKMCYLKQNTALQYEWLDLKAIKLLLKNLFVDDLELLY